MKALRFLAILSLVAVTQSFGSIVNSKHDLSYQTNTISATNADSNSEICVFCHTPHASNSSFAGAPLWNKEDSTTTYLMYGASTVGNAGTTLAGNSTATTVSNSSKACLSCHDGVSAINSLVNAPGSGLGNKYTGMTDGTTTVTKGDAAGDMLVMPDGVTSIGRYDTAEAAGVADLTNDHPVSIQYLGDGSATSPASLRAIGGTFGGGGTWTTPDGTQNIASVLRGGGNDMLECASCHDPHLTDNGTFLRTSNTGSKLCLGCHDK